jgi:hypothetical protein
VSRGPVARRDGEAIGTQAPLEVLAQDRQPLLGERAVRAPAGAVAGPATELPAAGLAGLRDHPRPPYGDLGDLAEFEDLDDEYDDFSEDDDR